MRARRHRRPRCSPSPPPRCVAIGAGDGRRRLQGARDLRQRRLRRSPARTSRSPASRSARSTRSTSRSDYKAVGRARHPATRLPGLPRRRAAAQVRPQSLIGEKFVECTPTQTRAVGAEPPPPLQQDRRRRRARASTCCRSRTPSKPVDLDLINNIMRLPYRQRLSLILNELGTGLAGRGADLNAGHPPRRPGAAGDRQGPQDPRRRRTRCSPTSRATPTRSLAPLARERSARRAASSSNSSEVAAGDGRARRRPRGRHRAAAARSCASCTPTMRRLGALSRRDDAGAHRPRRRGARHQPHDHRARPVLAGRHPRASSRSARPPKIGTPALERRAARSIKDLRRLAQDRQAGRQDRAAAARVLQTRPAASSALMDYIFYQVAADQRLRRVRPLPARRA